MTCGQSGEKGSQIGFQSRPPCDTSSSDSEDRILQQARSVLLGQIGAYRRHYDTEVLVPGVKPVRGWSSLSTQIYPRALIDLVCILMVIWQIPMMLCSVPRLWVDRYNYMALLTLQP